MRLVLVESPYMFRHPNPAESRLGLVRNVAYARLALKDCILRGEAPFASHLLLTQPLVLDDDIPAERALGIKAGLAWGDRADVSVLYRDLGISTGMRLGFERAEAAGRPIEQRQIAGWDGAETELPSVTLARLGLYSEADIAMFATAQAGPFGANPQRAPPAGPLPRF